MADCESLKVLARQCGRNSKGGISPDIFMIAFSDLIALAGTTEVYTESVTGLIDEIGVAVGKKFVKVGTALKNGSIKQDYTANDNGTYDIVKQLAFLLNNLGSLEVKEFSESLMGQPVAAIVKLNSNAFLAVGLNGQFQLQTIAGEVTETSNGNTVTISGSDSVLYQPVDPTIVAGLLEVAV